MRQKSNSTPASSETLVRNIRRATRSTTRLKRRLALCSMACAARPQSPSFAGGSAHLTNAARHLRRMMCLYF